MPYKHFSNMIWKALTNNKCLRFGKNKNVFHRIGFNCDGKHAISKLDLKNTLQALFKYGLESVLPIKDAFGLKKNIKVFPLRLFWL